MVQDFIFRNCFVTAVTCSFNPRLLQITFPFVFPETKSPVGPENSNGWSDRWFVSFGNFGLFSFRGLAHRIHGTGIFSLQTSRLWRLRPLNWACTLRGDLRRWWVKATVGTSSKLCIFVKLVFSSCYRCNTSKHLKLYHLYVFIVLIL